MRQAEVNRSYREAEIRGASSVECTIMLYEMAISDLRKAIHCLGEGDIEGRTNALVHSLHVLEQLQGTLQMESGGAAAKHLYGFYSLARAKILEGQMKSRGRLLEEILEAMQRMQTIWKEVRESCQPARAGAAEAWMVAGERSASGAWSA